MNRLLGQMVLLAAAAVILGLGRNVVIPGGLPWVGDWAVIDSLAAAAASDPAIKPPSAQPFVSLAEARAKYDDPSAVFVDAREPEEYEQGHIAGAVLLPFDWVDDYWPQVEKKLPRDREIVTYCSGAECESSLFLARYLRGLGYDRISIFYGGWMQWRGSGGPIATGQPRAEG